MLPLSPTQKESLKSPPRLGLMKRIGYPASKCSYVMKESFKSQSEATLKARFKSPLTLFILYLLGN